MARPVGRHLTITVAGQAHSGRTGLGLPPADTHGLVELTAWSS
jgi:hypothetical protein